ncbi:MAG: UvrD-helicase domain-containing protein [Mariprofundaceae bacterium]|nr:UvrD-helicase domain-containing protein [Mariprofundaceae bacterium]
MKNIQLISASAGSGKTYRLMNEIAQRISGEGGGNPVAPEQIMATTFTNKAAAELKERIRMRLLDESKADEAQRIYDGLIGTVNSICSRLLKEYAFEAGLSPAVDVLLEEDASRIFNIATASAIDKAGKQLEPIARRLGLMGYGSAFAKQADWRDFVREIVNLARSNAMTPENLTTSGDESWASLESLLGKSHGQEMGIGLDERLKDAVFQAVNLIEAGEKVNKLAQKSLQNIHQKLSKGWELSWVDWLEIENIEIGKRGGDLVKDLWGPWAAEGSSEHLKHPRFRDDMQAMIKGVFDCAGHALEQYALYKREQGLMDFVDQEALVLDMATNNPSFQASIKERVKLLMVDEFQDTSPIQLALFLKFSELAEDVVWVGDQKQSIYGFRGADPVLMDAVASDIELQAGAASADNVLKDSWRSKEQLVSFCNEIFGPVFHQMGEDKVRLNIPEARKESAKDGWLENWVMEGSNIEKRSSALVSGIKDLITERKIKAGDIAILCRSNKECETVSASLNAIGIRASIAQGDLLATNECTLALAALRYMADQQDTIAMAEIVCFSRQHSAHDDWLKNLLNDGETTQASWQEDPLMVALTQAGKKAVYLTPLESLEKAMASVNMERTVHAWGNVDLRLSNLDQLRAACIEYQNRCKSRHSSATVIGFLTWLSSEAELKQAESSGENTVNVLTYHKSKGLELPVVVMTSLNKPSKSRLFGVSVSEAKIFTAETPLNGRSIRFWPWPYGAKKKGDALDACLAESDIAKAAINHALLESQRVLYVGMTRARDGLILVQEKAKKDIENKWLDELIDEDNQPVLNFSDGKMSIITNGEETKVFKVTTRELTPPCDAAEVAMPADESRYLPKLSEAKEYPAATRAPSSADWGDASGGELSEEDVTVSSVATLGEHLKLTDKPKMTDFGNAMHGFLGADLGQDEAARLSHAENLLTNWAVEDSMTASDVLLASDRLNQYITEHYPTAKVKSEWAITMVLENNQRMTGMIDMLLELSEGYVIIDHKSYLGGNAAEHAKQYAPQLAVYKKAVELATDKPVLKTLIHMPLLGEVFDVIF